MVTPQRSDETIKMRANANELRGAEWQEEERTNPVIVQVMHGPQKQSDLADTISKAGDSAAKIVAVKNWMQVVALLILVVGVVAALYLQGK